MNCAKQLIQHISENPRTFLVRLAHEVMSEGKLMETVAFGVVCHLPWCRPPVLLSS